MTKILIVDDDAMILELLSEIVRSRLGLEISKATNGLAGLECFNEFGADIVLTDIICPDGNGFDGMRLGRELRAINPDIPIIFMSGYTGEYDCNNLEDISCYFLPKPFKVEELLDIIKRALAQPVAQRPKDLQSN